MPKINMMKMLPQTQWRPSSRSATMKELHAGEKSATRPLQWEQNQPMHGPTTLRGIKHQQCLCVSQYTKCPKNASPATTGVPSVPKVWKVLQQRRTVSVSRCLPPHPHLAQVCLLNLQLNRHFKCVGNVKSTGRQKRAKIKKKIAREPLEELSKFLFLLVMIKADTAHIPWAINVLRLSGDVMMQQHCQQWRDERGRGGWHFGLDGPWKIWTLFGTLAWALPTGQTLDYFGLWWIWQMASILVPMRKSKR